MLPNLQEYFSAKYLKLKWEGIFIPGYFLDVPAGNYICPDEISIFSRLLRPKSLFIGQVQSSGLVGTFRR